MPYFMTWGYSCLFRLQLVSLVLFRCYCNPWFLGDQKIINNIFSNTWCLRGNLKRYKRAWKEFRWFKLVFIDANVLYWYSCFQKVISQWSKQTFCKSGDLRGRLRSFEGDSKVVQNCSMGAIIFTLPSGLEKGIKKGAKQVLGGKSSLAGGKGWKAVLMGLTLIVWEGGNFLVRSLHSTRFLNLVVFPEHATAEAAAAVGLYSSYYRTTLLVQIFLLRLE